jgi:hypothetical protein
MPSAGHSPLLWLEWLDPDAADASDWLRRYRVLAAEPDLAMPFPAISPTTADNGPGGEAPRGNDEDLVLIASLVLRNGSFTHLANEWWPFLRDIARARSAPGAALPGDRLGPDQTDDPQDLEASRQHLAELLNSTTGQSRDIPTDVRLDTLRLYLGLPPDRYPRAAGKASCERYLDALWDLWSEPDVESDIQRLAVRLLAAARAEYADPLGEPAVTLLQAVLDDDRVPLGADIAGAIAGLLAETPGLIADHRLTESWWTRLERVHPDIRTPAARLRAAVHRPGADPAEVALLIGQAASGGLTQEQIATIVGAWLSARRGHQGEAVFRIVEGVVQLAGAANGRDYDEYLMILASRLGITRDRTALLRRSRRTRP